MGLGVVLGSSLLYPKGYSCSNFLPKGPCTQIVYTLAQEYLEREYFKAKVYTIWVHGPLNPKP